MAAEALQWISTLLQSRGIPFQICGGLAAIAHGATRALHDIDLFVPGERFAEVVAAGEDAISKPARRYTEHQWDIDYVQFAVFGTKVEVGSARGAKIFDSKRSCWQKLNIDFLNSQIIDVLGQTVPVMNKDSLVSYKKILGRAVDLEDIRAIELASATGQ